MNGFSQVSQHENEQCLVGNQQDCFFDGRATYDLIPDLSRLVEVIPGHSAEASSLYMKE